MGSEFSLHLLDQLINCVVLYSYNFLICYLQFFNLPSTVFDKTMLTFLTVIINSLIFFIILQLSYCIHIEPMQFIFYLTFFLAYSAYLSW